MGAQEVCGHKRTAVDGGETNLQRLQSNHAHSGLGRHRMGQQSIGILMKLLIEKFKTSEFWLMFLSSSVIIYLMLKSSLSLEYHAIGLTILICGYMFSRCLYKQMRSAAQVKGFLTSEFHFLVTGVLALSYFSWIQRLSVGMAILLSCILLGVYFISRGISKRNTQRHVPFL